MVLTLCDMEGDLRTRLAEYPQPVAIAVGRLLRSRSLPEQLDAATKAAEVLTRYCAVLALSSYAAREGSEPASEDPPAIGGMEGPLSFGHYLNAILEVTARTESHPLAPYFASLFKDNKRGQSTARGALGDLLDFRNREGHDLHHLDEVKAQILQRERDPVGRLSAALDALQGLLQLPLLVIDDQRVRGSTITATCLRLVGEGTPFPEDINLVSAGESIRIPYLVTRKGLLPLAPGVIWLIVEQQRQYGLFFIDSIDPGLVKFKAVADGSLVSMDNFLVDDVHGWAAGRPAAIEDVYPVEASPASLWWRAPSADRDVQPGSPAEVAAEPVPGTDGEGAPAVEHPEPDAEVRNGADGRPAAAENDLGPVVEAPPDEGRAPDVPDEPARVGNDAGSGEEAPSTADREQAVPPTRGVPKVERSFVAKDPRVTRSALVEWIAGEGLAVPEVADRLGLPRTWISAAVRGFQLERLLKPSARGLQATEEQVSVYEAGAPVSELAVKLEVSQPAALRALVAGGAVLRAADSELVGGLQPSLSRSYLQREFIERKRTLEDIGKENDLSRERVRQILQKYGMPTRVQRTVDPAEQVSEELLRHMYVTQTLSLNEIAGQLGVRPDQVAELAARYGLARPRVYERHGLTKDLMHELYVDKRMSVGAIAEKLSVSRQAVDAALAKHGIKKRSHREAVGKGINKVLTPEYLAERVRQGSSIAEIARDHGTTQTTVRKYMQDAGLLPDDEPDPRYDALLTPEFIQSAYLDAGLTQVEFCSLYDVPVAELRIRTRRAGLKVARPRNSQLQSLPDAPSVRSAAASGRPTGFPLSDEHLRRLYLEDGKSVGELAKQLEVEQEIVLRALCAAGIEVRLGFADRLSEPWLRRRYLDDGASAVDIAREVGTTAATVKKYLETYGIQVRGRSEARRPERSGPLTEEFLRVEYEVKGRSADDIGDEVGLGAHQVLTAVRSFGIPVRPARGGAAARARLRKVFTADYLEQELVVKGRSPADLAAEHGSTERTVLRYASKFGIWPGAAAGP